MWRKAGVGVLAALLGVGGFGCAPKGEDELPPISRTYANPIALEDEWGEYGLGDPFIFKYNGYYYLYVSTRDTDEGIKVWRSPDLAKWTYEGLCAEEPLTKGAYAPEVRYWNGKFYMYTSPAGQGHYVLVADKPTGPFKAATDNFGRTIDGSTFVDDDGRWYFYYAGPSGIQAAPMEDPLTVAPDELPTGAYMGGWTEGPTVFKRDGKYFMTYTGNHVFSAGYRVDAAVSDSPLQGFQGFGNNPVLLRTEGPTVGLGHNSLVRGPDLDTDYMIYHNLEGPGVVGPLRHMNMDRIVWNGDRFYVAGPTAGPQPAPELPDFEDRFERSDLGSDWEKKGGDGEWTASPEEGLIARTKGSGELSMLLAKPKTEEDYTAEFHVRVAASEEAEAAAGAAFSYEDEDSYGVVLLDPGAGRVTAEVRRDGRTEESAEAALPANVDLSQLHELRMEKQGRTLRFYVDGMNVLRLELRSDLGAGRVGYAARNAEAGFGYAAFSGHVGGSGARTAYAPIPGAWQAVHSEDGGAAGGGGIGGDAANGYYAAGLKKGDSLSYRMNVGSDGEYSLRFRVKPGPEGAKFRLVDGKTALTPDIEVKPDPSGAAGEWLSAGADGVKLKAGPQRWKLEIVNGTMDFLSADVAKYATATAAKEEFEDRSSSGWTRYEGVWTVKEGQLRASSVQPAKILWGDYGWTDYEFEADLTVPEEGGRSGVLVRATNPANGMDQRQNRTDFVQGYYVYADAAGLHLAKLNYGTVPLADADYSLPKAGEWLHLKVRAAGDRITVYAGDADKPVLDYADRGDAPFLRGKVGFQAADTASRFDHASVAPASRD